MMAIGRIASSLDAISQLAAAVREASFETRLTREQLQSELKSTRVLAERAFLAIMSQLETISRQLENR